MKTHFPVVKQKSKYTTLKRFTVASVSRLSKLLIYAHFDVPTVFEYEPFHFICES